MSNSVNAKPFKAFVIHGIRDFGEWQDAFAATFPDSELFRYDKFWLERFILEFMYSGDISIRIANRLRELSASHRVNVVCHSYGTHLIAKVLSDNNDIRIHNLIFCGSIAKADHRFDLIHERKQIEGKIYNFAGTRDIWPACASIIFDRYSPSGVLGIAHPSAINVFEPIGHGGFLQLDQWNKHSWSDILSGGSIKNTTQTGRSFLVSFLLWFSNRRWLFFSSIAALIILTWGVSTKHWAWTCSIRECFYDITQRIQYSEELSKDGKSIIQQSILGVYQFDHGVDQVRLGSVGPKVDFYDVLTELDQQNQSHEWLPRLGKERQRYMALATSGNRAIVQIRTRWEKKKPDMYPGGVEIEARNPLRNLRVSIQLPERAEIIPYHSDKHGLEAVYKYSRDAKTNEIRNPTSLKDSCSLIRESLSEISCQNVNLKEGEKFRYCFGIKNWDGDNAEINAGDCNDVAAAVEKHQVSMR